MLKKSLLAILLLMFLFFFTSPAYCYTWVKLGDYPYGTVWYEPTTIETDEDIGSVLIKVHYPKDDKNIIGWIVTDCKAKRYNLVGVLAVDKNDKALKYDEGDEFESDIVPGSESAAEDLYKMLCPKTVKK